MRIFLTGVSGYLGTVLARHLANMPQVESITGIDVAPPKESLPAKVCFQQLDVRSAALVSVMAGHDVVIHTAFIVLWKARMPAAERDDIVRNGTRNVARAARANFVRRFIHASSIAAYDVTQRTESGIVTEDFPLDQGQSSWYYTSGKAAAERALHEVLDGSPTVLTILRPTLIVGPCNRDTLKGFRESPIRIPGRDPVEQWVHEDDVARAFVQAARQDMPGAYNVVPDDTVKLSEVQQILGLTSPRTVPLWLAWYVTQFRWRFLNGDMHPSWLGALFGYSGRTYSNAKLRATGWEPRFSSAEAVRDAVRA